MLQLPILALWSSQEPWLLGFSGMFQRPSNTWLVQSLPWPRPLQDLTGFLSRRLMSHVSNTPSLIALMRYLTTISSSQPPTFIPEPWGLSSALPHAGDWLNVIPSYPLNLQFQDRELWLCLVYWLGLRMTEKGARCPTCQGEGNAFGDHQVGCRGNGDRIH